MQIAQIVLEYLKVLVWPIVVSFFVWHFRNSISSFIDRMLKFKFPGGEVEAEGNLNIQRQNQTEDDDDAEIEIPEKVIEDIKSELEEKYKSLEEDSKKAVEKLLNEVSVKEIQLDFERVYNSIFGSQIRLLEILLPKTEGETRSFLESYYTEVKKNYAPALDAWNLDNYLQFLIQTYSLVEVTPNGNYKITTKGIGFLSYINSRNYSKIKSF